MNRNEIQERIRRNLEDAGMENPEIRVQPDLFGGWRIAVICSDFEGRSVSERRTLSLNGMGEERIEWLDLLTEEERQWAGALPIDSDLEDLPLWAESLARGMHLERKILFPSDLDSDLAPPIVTTFYSLRGGVGRSTALAYTARILSHRGYKVVCLDMDLEAPGLAALFGVERAVHQSRGVLEALIDLDQEEAPDFPSLLIPVEGANDLYLIPAGQPDADYARRLRFIDPTAWYREERNPLRLLLKGVEEGLPFRPDAVLIDARTGITPLSGPLLFDMADIAIVVFFPHPQAYTGTKALVRGLLAARTRRSDGDKVLSPEPRFLISPVPQSRAPEILKRYEHRATKWISEWLAPANALRDDHEALMEEEIAHVVRYREDIATSDAILSDSEVWRSYEPVAEWIQRFLPTVQERSTAASISTDKVPILGELRFAAGTAEQQDHFLETFVETEVVKGAMDPKIPLILGRKGSGKTAVFRRMAEGGDRNVVVAQAPSALRGPYPWMLTIDGFKSIEKDVLHKTDADWRHFWAFYLCIGLSRCLGAPSSESMPEGLGTTLKELPRSEPDIVTRFLDITQVPRFGLWLNEWLASLDAHSKKGTFLVFDGLDTGFGNSEEDRTRRQKALEGLLTLWIDRGDAFQNLTFKILLREDIWRKLRFENKSHLFGRSVTLKWNRQADYFRVVLKQALLSKRFEALFGSMRKGSPELASLEGGGESEVFQAWNLLVGERMKGGNTTFTRNWVWNRLADGNGDHTPRYLLQLFHQVVPWELEEHRRNPYERSIIRPRALIACLRRVSEEALGALKEEFVELDELFSRLSEIGRTPLPASALEELADQVALAREVGLLSVYEGTEEEVDRFKVPDIYRYGLGMTRKGQE